MPTLLIQTEPRVQSFRLNTTIGSPSGFSTAELIETNRLSAQLLDALKDQDTQAATILRRALYGLTETVDNSIVTCMMKTPKAARQ